ncbi:hypothetical protein GCM10027161_50360 [Microbispora hainanensis]
MAKIRCRCMYVITTSGEIPNPLEWKIISDSRFDDFEGLVDAEEIYRACTSMFRCPVCGRLWVYWNGFDRDPECYAPEIIGDLEEGQ